MPNRGKYKKKFCSVHFYLTAEYNQARKADKAKIRAKINRHVRTCAKCKSYIHPSIYQV